MSDNHDNHQSDPGWADTPAFKRFFSWGLYISCILAAAAGFVHKWHKKNPHFELETFPVFFAIYGFAMFFGIVILGQHLRKLVGRDEKYYEERE